VDSARALVDSLRGTGALLISCGTIWVHGTLVTVPAKEDDARNPWGEYGVGKSEIEDFLLAEARKPGGVRSIVLRPGHISGPGWRIINPIANVDLDVWDKLATGDEILLPGNGLETVHHVHADDVAQAFMLAIENAPLAVGLSFNIVSEYSLTLRGYAESVASWSGREANIRYVSMDEFSESLAPASAETSAEHISRSHTMSIERARRVLGYAPRYSSLEAVAEAVEWLRADGQIA
jgi:nucleoside-diphosphate-sugar epimerase